MNLIIEIIQHLFLLLPPLASKHANSILLHVAYGKRIDFLANSVCLRGHGSYASAGCELAAPFAFLQRLERLREVLLGFDGCEYGLVAKSVKVLFGFHPNVF